MAETKTTLNVLVTGGSESAGLATVKMLLQRGHQVVATTTDADGALAIRQLGALPVYPDLSRESEVLSILKLAKADALVHATPQDFTGVPHIEIAADADGLLRSTNAVMGAAAAYGVKRVVSLSSARLYQAGHGAAKEGDHDSHDSDLAPMLAAEKALLDSNLSGFVIRAGYIYGGNSAATAALADLIKRSKRLPAGDQDSSWIHEDDLAAAIVALVEAEDVSGSAIINAAGAASSTPNAFAAAVGGALGLSAPGIAGGGMFSMLRAQTARDKLLARAIVIDSGKLRDQFGWQPQHENIESGLDATALVWRMNDAVNADDYYNVYEDKAADAIEALESGAALPEPVAAVAVPPALQESAAPKPAPTAAAAPAPSDGPTPWSEDEAKREERRRKALERRAKRAAQSAGG